MRKLLTSAIVGAVLVTGVASAAPLVPPSATAQRPLLTTLPAALTSAFAVFALPAGPQDRLPSALASLIAQGPPAWLGINPLLAKRVGSTWVMPGTDSICVMTQLPDGSARIGCSDRLATAINQGLAVGSSAEAAGLVPNGVRHVTISASGRVHVASVTRNVFAAHVSRPQVVRFSLRGRRHALRLG